MGDNIERGSGGVISMVQSMPVTRDQRKLSSVMLVSVGCVQLISDGPGCNHRFSHVVFCRLKF